MILADGLLRLFHHSGMLLDLIDITRPGFIGISAVILGIVQSMFSQQLGQYLGSLGGAQLLQKSTTSSIHLIDNIFGNQRLGLAAKKPILAIFALELYVWALNYVHVSSYFTHI